ncbi:MAG: DUF2271 domain-containing protein [Candidatus Margulisbacteria bacterium]|nr:DUF2271 domain-containing protein [Candidatus Margulisiibacteriota bacterium]MBU1617271.1 DUF2271 domain-containing protein [Candidatus Margulisiibacteriota bacterium]
MKNIIALSLLLMLLNSFSLSLAATNRLELATNIKAKGKRIRVLVDKGAAWSHKYGFLFVGLDLGPQLAVWTEDTYGNYMETLYVTKFWSGRKEALPYWRQRIDQKHPEYIDAVTGATQMKDWTLTSRLGKEQDTIVVKAELNNSFDYNKYFTKENSGVNGQPSVVYAATVDIYDREKPYTMKLVGCGSLDGSDGLLHPETSKLTSAKEIIKSLTVEMF